MSIVLDAARSKRSEITCMERFRYARTKNELATKFVVGLERVRENFVVYWREIGRNEKV